MIDILKLLSETVTENLEEQIVACESCVLSGYGTQLL